jgi:hypothetical protein
MGLMSHADTSHPTATERTASEMRGTERIYT